jgi:hypothetical protein
MTKTEETAEFMNAHSYGKGLSVPFYRETDTEETR